MAKTPTERDEARRARNEEKNLERASASHWVPKEAKAYVRDAMREEGKRALKRWERMQKKGGPEG